MFRVSNKSNKSLPKKRKSVPTVNAMFSCRIFKNWQQMITQKRTKTGKIEIRKRKERSYEKRQARGKQQLVVSCKFLRTPEEEWKSVRVFTFAAVVRQFLENSFPRGSYRCWRCSRVYGPNCFAKECSSQVNKNWGSVVGRTLERALICDHEEDVRIQRLQWECLIFGLQQGSDYMTTDSNMCGIPVRSKNSRETVLLAASRRLS